MGLALQVTAGAIAAYQEWDGGRLCQWQMLGCGKNLLWHLRYSLGLSA